MEILFLTTMQMLNIPYKWGGNHPLEGFDCSGLIQYLLSANGDPIPDHIDRTAQGIFDYFSINGSWNVSKLGSLAFFGKDARSITHIAMLVDEHRIIEAAGGDHLTLTKEDAVKKGALVRISMLSHRRDLIAIIRPSFSKIGHI